MDKPALQDDDCDPVLNGVVWESIKTLLATADEVKEQVKQIRHEIELTLAAPAVKVNDSTDVMVRTRVLN